MYPWSINLSFNRSLEFKHFWRINRNGNGLILKSLTSTFPNQIFMEICFHIWKSESVFSFFFLLLITKIRISWWQSWFSVSTYRCLLHGSLYPRWQPSLASPYDLSHPHPPWTTSVEALVPVPVLPHCLPMVYFSSFQSSGGYDLNSIFVIIPLFYFFNTIINHFKYLDNFFVGVDTILSIVSNEI